MSDISVFEVNEPNVMVVSSFSSIALKLNFLATALSDEDKANNTLVYIECFTRRDGEDDERVIRFSTDDGIWTEINPLHKHSSKLLESNVAVNLYDLYNVIGNCEDDLISFWIDSDDNELVINAWYNPDIEADELEVRLPIHKSKFDKVDRIVSTDIDSAAIECEFALDGTACYTTANQLNSEHNVDGVHVSIGGGKLSFWSEYNGLLTKLEMKEDLDRVYDYTDISFYIPFNIYNLMVSTGEIKELLCRVVKVDDSYVLNLSAGGYEFSVDVTESTDINLNTFDELDADAMEKLLIIDVKQFNAVMGKINKLNAPSPMSEIAIDRVDDAVVDFMVSYENRFDVNVRTYVATLSEVMEPVKIDGRLFTELIEKSGVDAFAVYRLHNGLLYIKYENAVSFKSILYNHDKFMSYRVDEIKKSSV
jgi:hypothetical protein